MKKVIYIAGPITGRKNFKDTFADAADELRSIGYQVLNPAELPDGMTESAYMDICLAMVRQCDGVLMLDGWEDSTGASCERALALKCGKPVYYSVDDLLVTAADGANIAPLSEKSIGRSFVINPAK